MKLKVTRNQWRSLRLEAAGLSIEFSRDALLYRGFHVRRPPWFAGWFAWLSFPGFEVFVSWWRA